MDKFTLYILGMRPLYKELFGLDDALAAGIVSGGIGLLGSVFAGTSARKSQSDANAANYYIAKENNKTMLDIAAQNNQMQRDLAQENNELQVSMQRENNEFNAQQAELAYQRNIDMFNRENVYNSPIEQMKRYQAAGLNPAVAMTEATSATAGGSSSPVASAASSGITTSNISPSMPILTSPQMSPVPTIGTMLLDNLGKIADTAVKVQQARKSGAETKLLKDTMDDVVSKLHSEALTADALQKYQTMSTQLYQKYGDLKWTKDLKKLDEEINSLMTSQELTSLQQDEVSARIDNLINQTELTRSQLAYAKEKAARAKEFVNEELNAIRNGAEAAIMNATASLKNASAAQLAAAAANMNAQTNDYLAHNPKDFGSYLVRAVEDSGLSPSQVGSFVSSFIQNNVPSNQHKSFWHQLLDFVGDPYFDVQNGNTDAASRLGEAIVKKASKKK